MKRLIIGLVLFALGMIGNQLSAHGSHHPKGSIQKEQLRQHKRIKQGIRNGELTPREAARLRSQQAQIQREKRIAKADGRVTPRERRYIREDQARASRNIYRQKHDCGGR